ncbi:unnamed protein product [Heligmosomoides polygyrus]|uniref:Integrase n=1 Tax=Heligmosomoides polygyrus TaxID=6339 RepID=A0A183GL27_HELPZ|nr:unnamed protein product [Heligmosomoides polygyrus]
MKENEAARSELVSTKPGRRKVVKQTWLWTDDVKANVREESLYHVFLGDETSDNWRSAKKRRELTRRLWPLQKPLITRNRHRQTEDIEKFFGINDENGRILINRKEALKRWRDYLEGISTEEFPHPAVSFVAPIHGSAHMVIVGETEAALRKMRPGKASGLDFRFAYFRTA